MVLGWYAVEYGVVIEQGLGFAMGHSLLMHTFIRYQQYR